MQETNLNVSPYFDDFDVDKSFYKVLFKPTYPVQARELNTFQSILQNQVEQFGKNIFKGGSRISGAEWKYDNPVSVVEIENEFSGVPISFYFEQLLNKKIRGAISGVSAKVVYILNEFNSERSNYTLYVQYLESGGENFTNRFFQNGETLLLEEPLVNGNLALQAGQGICNIISNNGLSSGSLFSIADGVYFVNGFFVNVKSQTIILDQYGTNPSYKVGFNVNEIIVTSDEDDSLYDIAQGFSNYAAPGADRLKIELELTKKNLDELELDNFVEIFRVENGVPTFLDKDPQYNLIRDYLAKRTYDESGNFFVKPFTLFVRDSLNDRVLNDGIYFEDQKTVLGNNPSEDTMIYQIGSGKAYVNGYDVEIPSSRLLEVPKSRTTETLKNQSIKYNAGTLFILNRVNSSASIGLGTNATVSLLDSRIGISSSVAIGTTIGLARVYDFVPESDYIDNTSRFELRLFDIQTYTTIGLNTSFSNNITTPAFIFGKKSNASGYLKETVSAGSTIFTLYQVSGKFLENEQITINEIDNGRIINYVKDYDLSDVKSIYSNANNFNADVVLDTKSYIAKPGTQFKILNGVVSAGNENTFIKTIKPGDIISYASTSFTGDPIYNKVTSVSAAGTSFTVTGITTVSGICDGSLPTGQVTINNILKVSPTINAYDNSLLTRLDNDNIESIVFEGDTILQRREFTSTFSNSTINITIPTEDVDIYFESFDEDRFLISYSDGNIEKIRRDKFNISTDGKTITFVDLSKSSGTAKIIATVKNLKPNSKIKKLNKVSSLVIDKSKYISSGIGTTTLNNGLTYNQIFGLRVEDSEISLNVPDVVRVLAIYESNTTSDPNLPTISFNGTTGNTNTSQDFNIGEWITGKSTGATALVVSRKDSSTLEYVYLNAFQFSANEVIKGKDSKTEAIISSITTGDKNITKNYILDNGQRETIYDYSRIIRKKNVSEPLRKLKIIFQNYTIDSSDTGEFITANSYPVNGFKYDVPYFENSRLTDFIDIRPRVAPFTGTTKSPFEFDARNFSNDGQYSKYILAPGENIITSYSYYVGRIDRVFLNSDGTFEVVQGIPNSNIPPYLKSNSLDIATIFIPPYVYDVKNIKVDMSKHKRYRMEDISILEDRLQRVEKFTTLSMLESKTENLIIRDAETGLDRFKCGFFVDNFSTHEYHDLQNPSFRAAIDTSTNTLRPLHYTTSLDLQLGSEVISGVGQTFSPNKDQSYVSDLGSPNIKKTGDLITLNYNEVLYFEQAYSTKTESITPFLVKFWSGRVQLNPPIDSWVEEKLITSNSFNEITNTKEPLPDENITIVNDVVVNNEVWTATPITQTGIFAFDWINNARNVLSGISKIAGVVVDVNRGNIGNGGNTIGSKVGLINNGRTLLLAVNVKQVTDKDRNLIRRLLPADVANQFLTQISTTRNQGLKLEFTPSNPTITEARQVNTTVETVSNTSTIIIPPEVITTESVSESISNYTEPVRFLRSRNIEFDVKGLRPVTRFYPFLEGIDVSNYIIPKLLEVEMISGAFQIGETVESDPHFTTNKIKFRLCNPNHKTGEYNSTNSIDFYKLNPYTQRSFPNNYTETTTILNVDTKSLQLTSETDFYGSISVNMILIGKTSGAVARVVNNRLVSDNQGRLIGSLFIPDPNIPGNPKWVNGENTFTVIDIPSLDLVNEKDPSSDARLNQSSAEVEFSSSAISNITENNIITTRNVTIIPSRNINTTTITNTTTNTTSVTQSIINQENRGARIWETGDPLAQSFYVKEDTGIFVTSVEIFFETKDENIPVTLQIRPMVNGVPSNVVVPFSEVTLSPDEIELSVDASAPTKFTFPSPVYLPGPSQLEVRQAPIGSQQTSEFAIVLLSNSPQYRVFVSELGFNDIQTGIKITDQPTLGSLFKSQNGSTWSPAQFEDLKYRLNRADFVSEGIVKFFNPKLSLKNKKITVTGENQITPLSKRIIVGLGSTGYDQINVVSGVTIKQNSASGKLIGIGGSIKNGQNLGTVVSNPGFGYTSGTFSNITLKTETGVGRGAVATIGVVSSGISTVTITDGGFGYQIGDTLSIPETGMGQNTGFGGKLTVINVNSNNTFILDNVQGTFSVGVSTVYYLNSVGTAVTIGNGVQITNIFEDPYYDGLHMKINHLNHGMHSSENLVKISSMRPSQNEINSKTTSDIGISDVTIPLISSQGFETFEGLPVSATNPGYVIIGNEVIEYVAVNANVLQLINSSKRGIDGTEVQSYSTGVPVYKYEYNGISLRRLNKVHNFAEVDDINHPRDLHSYYIKIDNKNIDSFNNNIGKDRSNELFFMETVQSGRSGINLTNNIQYEAITPNVSNILPAKTNIISRIRTFSGTSIGGNEKSFVDDGFTNIPLNSTTYFSNPKLICSEINESEFITNSPGNKSFTMEFLMSTTDSRVSPVIDTIRTSVILTSNLLNNPVGIEEESNYANDDRVRSLYNDPHSCVYITKPVKLKLPANSLKVILSASRNETNDVRVLYQIFREDLSESSNNFELFPGYSNYSIDGNGVKNVINESLNDGSADSKVRQTSDRSFNDYEYTVDNLSPFTSFAIKIIMAGKNQATPPIIKNLRAIATIKPKV